MSLFAQNLGFPWCACIRFTLCLLACLSVSLVVAQTDGEAEYMDLGSVSARPLPVGFDFRRAQLESIDDSAFPDVRQFVVVHSHQLVASGLDRDRLLEGLNLERFRDLWDSERSERLHVLLTKSFNFDNPVTSGANPQFTLGELLSQTDAHRLEGPWKLWVDAADVVTRLIVSNVPLPGGRLVSNRVQRQFVCTHDGLVIGAFDSYWLHESNEALKLLIEACLGGSTGMPWFPINADQAVTQVPLLTAGAGEHLLSSAELADRPFLIFAPELTQPTDQGASSVVEQLAVLRQVMLDEGVLDLPVILLALPHTRFEPVLDGKAVAALFQVHVSEPVYEADEQFMAAMSGFVSHPPVVLAFESDWHLVGRFTLMTPAAIEMGGTPLRQVLRKLGDSE